MAMKGKIPSMVRKVHVTTEKRTWKVLPDEVARISSSLGVSGQGSGPEWGERGDLWKEGGQVLHHQGLGIVQ